MSYKRLPNQPLDEFIRNLKLKLQNLDEVGEVLPMKMRANLLLTSSNMSDTERAIVLATAGRSLEFNSIADAMQLLLGQQPSSVPRPRPACSCFPLIVERSSKLG
uniref:Uncharacterized protein n=1 Tax=Eutreptiella gymnastica TaxID=73025 RepID=A0A7S1NV49_9EUGL